GYDGAAADVWSCGVILFVLMAGYLPFEEIDLPTLCRKFQTGTDTLAFLLTMQGEMVKSRCTPCSIPQNTTYLVINAAKYSCPFWFSPVAKALVDKILDPNPKTRIGIEEIKKHPWFRKSYEPVGHSEEEEVNLDDVHAVFDDIEDHYVAEQLENSEGGPLVMNAFEMIALSQGLNLSALFDRRQDYVKQQTRFVSRKAAKVIISAFEAVAESMNLKFHTRNYKTRLEGISENNAGQFAVVLENKNYTKKLSFMLRFYEVAPSLFMVDARKASGETLEYHKVQPHFLMVC
ncbi:hypothetical protein H0E87_013242, partial [Populus deltoides]